jgi:hypothetical protein
MSRRIAIVTDIHANVPALEAALSPDRGARRRRGFTAAATGDAGHEVHPDQPTAARRT